MSTLSWNIHSYGHSDIGLVRKNNEDAWARDPRGRIYVLADGIGGRQAGEVASQQAVQRLCEIAGELYNNRTCDRPETICDLLVSSIQQVNREVYAISQENEFLQGMGTTLCALLVDGENAYIAHLGDSRVYLLRNRTLTQLTEDHKPASRAAVCTHLVTQALGIREHVQPTVSWQQVLPDDLFLLCTDGLSNSLSHGEILKTLDREQDLKERCHLLVDGAKEAGGNDNITTLLVHFHRAIMPSMDALAQSIS